MGRASPRKIHRYSPEFKRQAVKLSQLEGVEVQAVADALDIHPFMLSRWRKEMRDGNLRGPDGEAPVKPPKVRELKRLQALERAHALLQQEHELLKKAIRFCSARKRTSSPSSEASEERSQ
jgi:transposase